jgi:lysozyme
MNAEGLRLKAYQDQAGVWTIGYGHRAGVHPSNVITKDEAVRLLSVDLNIFEVPVNSLTRIGTTDNQFAAMVSLAFNIGIYGFQTSTVLRKHNLGDTAGAAAGFPLWDKAHIDGQLVVDPGLLARRQREAALYLS